MNPILLKPESDSHAQVVVCGQPRARLKARDYHKMRHELIQIAADGSLKMRERIVPLIGHEAEDSQALTAVAAWIAFAMRAHRGGTPFADPNTKQIAKLFDEAKDLRDAAAQMANLIGVPDVPPVGLDTLAARVKSLVG